MVDEGRVVGSEAGLHCAVRVYVGSFSVSIEEEVLAAIDVEAGSTAVYEYLWGVWE